MMLRTKPYLYYFAAYLNTTLRYLAKHTPRFHDKTPRAEAALPSHQDANTCPQPRHGHHRKQPMPGLRTQLGFNRQPRERSLRAPLGPEEHRLRSQTFSDGCCLHSVLTQNSSSYVLCLSPAFTLIA